MRNFWIDGTVDGRESHITGGPKNRDGGFELEIRQKEMQSSILGIRVEGKALRDGTLELSVWDKDWITGNERLLMRQGTKGYKD